MKIESRKTVYKYSLMTMLGVTKAISRIDYHIPTKWYSIIDSIRVSSKVLHQRLTFVDEEIEEEFREKERMIDRRLGKEKFYDEQELHQLRDKVADLDFDNHPQKL